MPSPHPLPPHPASERSAVIPSPVAAERPIWTADAQVVRRARKRWKCCNAHAAKVGNAPNCRIYIEPGEQYVEGDIDPYLAGGFGHDKLCLGCEPIAAQWHLLPEPAALLASCATRPPATRIAKVRGLTTSHAREYVGERVKRLGAIHRREAARLLALADASGDYAAFEAHELLGVQAAVGAVVGSARRRAA